MRRRTLRAAGFLVIAGIGLLGLRAPGGPHGDPSPYPRVGAPAPAITVVTPGGESFHPAAGKGEWLVFGAIWCPECNRELAALEAAASQDGGRLSVVVVEEGESARRVEEWRGARRFSFSLLLDPGSQTAQRYGVEAYPTSVFIDRAGRVVGIHLGPLPTLASARPYLAQLLR